MPEYAVLSHTVMLSDILKSSISRRYDDINDQCILVCEEGEGE